MRKVALLSAIFFLGVSTHSCKKDGNLTPGFEENSANVRFSDTTLIVASTIKEDSILSNKTSKALIGVYTDSVFGTSTASYYTQISMIGSNLDFGDLADLVVDSIVLVLKYDDYYGTEDQQTFEVFEVTEAFDEEGAYYSKDTLSIDNMTIGSKTFTPSLDSVLVGVNNQTAQLRIQLDNSFGQKLLDQSGTATYADNASFRDFFKGFHIRPTALTAAGLPRGATCYFEPNSSTSGLYLYYTDNSGIIPESKTYRFEINSSAQRFNNFSHDYSGTLIEQALNNTIVDTSIAFVQSMSGVKTHFIMPDIQAIIADGQKKIINQAELVIPVVDGSYMDQGIAEKLLVVAADSSGLGIFIPDIFLDSDYYGGTYDEIAKEYKFNITRHVHQLINNNRKDYGMILLVSGSAIQASRVIIKKQGNNLEGIKLNLTYSTTE
tara:strand:- start:3100 stop:4404 length:1305 start_codon:yes stop_codon:yes gene_type:complete